MHNLKHLKRVPIEIVFGQNKIVIFRATNTSTIKEGQRFRIRFKLEQEIISGQRIYGTFEVIKILGKGGETCVASSNRYPIELVFEGVNRCVIRVATKPSKIKKDHIFQIGGKL